MHLGPIFSTEFREAADIVGQVVMKRWGNVFLMCFTYYPLNPRGEPEQNMFNYLVEHTLNTSKIRRHQTTSTNVKQNFYRREDHVEAQTQ